MSLDPFVSSKWMSTVATTNIIEYDVISADEVQLKLVSI